MRSKPFHLLRGAASFRPLGAMGKDQVNASQVNQASEGYPYLTLACRQRHFMERCHLITARDIIDGGLGTTRHNSTKCSRLTKKLQVLPQVGSGPWGRSLMLRGVEVCTPQLGRGGQRLGCHRVGSGDDKPQVGTVRWTSKISQVLAQVGRESLGTVPDALGCAGSVLPSLRDVGDAFDAIE